MRPPILPEWITRDVRARRPRVSEALAEPHGVEIDAESELGRELETIIEPVAPGRPAYRLDEVLYEPVNQPGRVLY